MPFVRFRFLLPLCNAGVDVLLLIAAMHAVDAYRLTLRNPGLFGSRHTNPSIHSSYGMRTTLRRLNRLRQFTWGTLPATILAGIVSEALFPNGWLGWRLSSPFDLRWACLHFCFATAFWYAMGRCAETTRGNWRNLASEYIVARLIFVPAFLSFWLDSWGALCSMLLAVFWIVLALLLTFKGFLQTWQRFRSETVSAR